MRYFVLVISDVSGVAPHIIAEVVRDVPMEEERDVSLAASIAGERAIIATRAELQTDPVGRQALEAWEARDDAEFDRETLILQELESEIERTLHVVGEGDGARPAKRGSHPIPEDDARREAIIMARGLRASARTLVQRAKEQREGSELNRVRLMHTVIKTNKTKRVFNDD